MRIREIRQSRREFLVRLADAGLAATAAGLGLGATGCARPTPPAPAPEQAARTSAAAGVPGTVERTLPQGGEWLHEPIVLRDGDVLADRFLVVSSRFAGGPYDALVRVVGNRVRIRNVRIVGADTWQPHWKQFSRERQPRHGISSVTNGIVIHDVRDVALEHVAIEGVPQSGIRGSGIDGGRFEDIQAHHCYHGMQFIPRAPSRGIHVQRVHGRDMWGPGPGHWPRTGETPGHPGGHPSRLRPGGFIGGDALVLNTLRDALVEDCTGTGELFGGFKMTNPQKLEVRGMRGPNLQIKGTADKEWKIHKTPARDVWIHDCVFDKGLAYGAGRWANCIQISQNVASVLIERCALDAAGEDGHGIQVTIDSHARVVDCTFKGFNGRRGKSPAHAADVALGSTLNEDFAQVNTFVDQRRILLERQPGRRQPRG